MMIADGWAPRLSAREAARCDGRGRLRGAHRLVPPDLTSRAGGRAVCGSSEGPGDGSRDRARGGGRSDTGRLRLDAEGPGQRPDPCSARGNAGVRRAAEPAPGGADGHRSVSRRESGPDRPHLDRPDRGAQHRRADVDRCRAAHARDRSGVRRRNTADPRAPRPDPAGDRGRAARRLRRPRRAHRRAQGRRVRGARQHVRQPRRAARSRRTATSVTSSPTSHTRSPRR